MGVHLAPKHKLRCGQVLSKGSDTNGDISYQFWVILIHSRCCPKKEWLKMNTKWFENAFSKGKRKGRRGKEEKRFSFSTTTWSACD